MRCFLLRLRPKSAATPPILTRLHRKASQHLHVDPIPKVGRGTKLGSIFAAEGRHHLAENAEENAICRLVPHHGFLGWERSETGHEILPPDDDRLWLRQ